jgi:hypothetical protein
MRSKRAILIIICILASVAVCSFARQDPPQPPARPVGEALEGKIKQAAFRYYVGLVLGDPEQYFQGARMPLQTVTSGKCGTLDEAAARAMLKTLADKRVEKPLSKDERTEIIGNVIRTLDEADIRFIGRNTATLVFLVRHDPQTKADHLCSLTLHRPDPKAGEWKVIHETTDAEAVPEEYVK